MDLNFRGSRYIDIGALASILGIEPGLYTNRTPSLRNTATDIAGLCRGNNKRIRDGDVETDP